MMIGNNKDKAMTNKMGLTLFTAGLISGSVLFAACIPSAAQERSSISSEFSAQQLQQNDKTKSNQAPQNKSNQAPRVAPQRVAPQINAQPRIVTPNRTIQRSTTQQNLTPRVVGQPRLDPNLGVRSSSGPKVVSPVIAPRIVTPRGTRTVTAARLRGLPTQGSGRAFISGQNYSAWRSGYRIRRGNGWRTFVALSALGVIAIGASQYYPYAYISAPEQYCDGLTEDGCELMWQEVETLEGDVINQ